MSQNGADKFKCGNTQTDYSTYLPYRSVNRLS